MNAYITYKYPDLMHYGIKRRSGRYPYGSGERPFQGISHPFRRITANSAQKKAARIRAKKKAEEEAKRRHEENKGKILRAGRASEVLQYQGELTNQELQEVVTRLRLEGDLRKYSKAEVESGIAKVDEIMKTVKTGTEWVKIGTDAYNSLAEIYNATDEGKHKPLTLIGKGDGEKKKK